MPQYRVSDDSQDVSRALRVLESRSDAQLYAASTTRANLRHDPMAIHSCERLLAEIDALEDAQKTLRRAINTKAAALASLVNRCAGIAGLPDEIICLIFIEGYHYSVEPQRGRDQDPTKFLLAISHTCKRFRDISTFCTLLWARIYPQWHQKQRELWVQRSGTRELEIHAHHLWTPPGKWSADAPGDVFQRFHKWRSLCFSDASATTIADVLRMVPSTIECQSLRSVDIRTVTNADIKEVSELDDRLWGQLTLGTEGNMFPNLRNITLWNAPYTPWGMLENVATLDVNLSNYTWNYWCQLLQQTKVLETLFMGAEWRWNKFVDTYRGAPVILSHLHSLELRKNDAMFVKSFLRDVTAPSLDNLTLWMPTKYDIANVTWKDITQALSVFLPRSPLISKLTLRGGFIGIHQVIMLLKDSLGAFPLLPALQTIELGGKYLYSVNIRNALRDFVQGLSESTHRSLPMLILPDADEAAFLQPYVEKIESPKGPSPALEAYEGYGENNDDEGISEDESDELGDEYDYEEVSDFGNLCPCPACNGSYDDDDEDEDDYEVTEEDLMV